MNDEQSADYCECMLKKVIEKYELLKKPLK